MKYLLFLPMLFLCSISKGQTQIFNEPGEKVILENDKMKVVEHFSQPQGEVCGIGMHHHKPHLTIVLTDAKVQITSENGETQEVEVKSGTTLWFDAAETHSALNLGDQPTKMILIYLKD